MKDNAHSDVFIFMDRNMIRCVLSFMLPVYSIGVKVYISRVQRLFFFFSLLVLVVVQRVKMREKVNQP